MLTVEHDDSRTRPFWRRALPKGC